MADPNPNRDGELVRCGCRVHGECAECGRCWSHCKCPGTGRLKKLIKRLGKQPHEHPDE